VIRVALLTYKHKTHVINNDGSVLSNADVDFYIDDVSIDVVELAFLKEIVRVDVDEL
jgi:translation initiation factor 3 subunit L